MTRRVINAKLVTAEKAKRKDDTAKDGEAVRELKQRSITSNVCTGWKTVEAAQFRLDFCVPRYTVRIFGAAHLNRIACVDCAQTSSTKAASRRFGRALFPRSCS